MIDNQSPPGPKDLYVQRHLLVGWFSLAVFLVMGLILEILLAFKVDIYTRADQTTFRLMWRLAHGHGALLAFVHLAFSFTLTLVSGKHFPRPAISISGALIGATFLIPGGFFLGALGSRGGDPSAAIALVPVGAVLLIFSVTRLWLLLRDDRPRIR